MTLRPDAAVRPTRQLLVSHPAHLLALGFGAGLSRIAPGTIGTLLAIPVAFLLWETGSDVIYVAVVVALLFGGAWAAARTGAVLGAPDHGSIVIDEIVAFLIVLFFTGPSLARIAFAFLLFRLFDIFKPPPIRAIDARMKTGIGVMLDDLVAAAFALIVYAIVTRATGWPP